MHSDGFYFFNKIFNRVGYSFSNMPSDIYVYNILYRYFDIVDIKYNCHIKKMGHIKSIYLKTNASACSREGVTRLHSLVGDRNNIMR